MAVAVCASESTAQTLAGTAIVNTAQLRVDGGDSPIESNRNTIVVAERLDVALTLGSSPIARDPTIAATVLTNRGNGQEAFAVNATTSPAATGVVRLAIDGDGDGRYDSVHDHDLAGSIPALAPGQSVTLFALVAGTPDTVTISAVAVTGSGAPGTSFAGAGDGGGDAVTGPTGATASVTATLTAAPATPAAMLTKAAEVMAPDGSARAGPGATITYTLVARFPVAAAAPRVLDPIPAGTAYVPASLSLDGAPLSDAADADAGDATPARISVALADRPGGATRTVRFKVIIQ